MMKMHRSILALVFVLGVARSAHAGGPSPENVATARELYKQGSDAFDAGDAKTAIDKLSAAWSLVQTPLIGFTLARADASIGRLVEAREAALAVLRAPVAADETARSAQARKDAEALAASLEPRIPHVKIVVDGASGAQLTVKLDGIVVPEAALAVARQTNPGSHAATVDSDDGRHAQATVTVAESETKELRLSLPVRDPSAPPPKNPPPIVIAPVSAPEPARSKGLSPVVWIGVATTGAGLAVGIIAGAFTLAGTSTVKSSCTMKGFDGMLICPPDRTGDLSSAQTAAAVSTIGFIVAGVGAGLLVTGFVLSRSSSKTARIVPFLGPTSGISGTF
jgi:hypothetical protein